MRWRASLACCEDPPGQLERSREPARRRRRDPLARDLRPPGARWPRHRPGDERLAGERPARRARRHAGVPHWTAPQFRPARPAARARATPRRALRCGRRRHQQTAAVPHGHDPAAVPGDHPAPVRRDGVPGSELAGRGGGVGGRTAAAVGVPPRPVPRHQRQHAGRPGDARGVARAHRGRISRSRRDVVSARSGGRAGRAAHIPVRRQAQAL